MASEPLAMRPAFPPAPMAHRRREAAKVLGVSERHLWSLTHPRGPIRCVRSGACVLYPVSELEAWLARQLNQESKP